MEPHQRLVFIILPLVWSISFGQVHSARLLPTHTSQKSTWPWFSILPPAGQPALPNLFNFPLPPPKREPQPQIGPSPPFPFPKFALPPIAAPSFPSLPPFSSPKFPSMPPITHPVSSFPPFAQPKPNFPSIPPLPGKPDKSAGWLLAWGPSSWSTPSPPPPSFPWNNPTTPSFPWNNPSPSPPPPSLPIIPSFPWNNPSPSPPPPSLPTIPKIPLPWNTPSPPPPSPILPTIPTIPLPWNTPSPPSPSIPLFPWNNPSLSPPSLPTNPSFPWNTPPSPPPTIPTLPWLSPSPTPPKAWVDPSTLPPFGLPPDASSFPTGIKFTFSNFTNSWLPEAGVKVTWQSIIAVELSLQLLVEAIVKPITLIISQFSNPPGPGNWSWKNGLTDSKFSADVGATCTTLGENGFPEKGLIVIQAPIDNTMDTAITWFTVLFHGWSKEIPFNATLDHTPGTFGGFVTNVTNPNLNTFCSHPGSLNGIAAKQGQYVLH